MNKTERKAIEKLALSAYAVHLYEGLTIHGNYTLGEVIRYWRYAKEDVGAIAPQLYTADVNIFLMIDDYKHNVQRLEDEIAERIADVAKNGDTSTDRDDRVEIAIAQLPAVFELRSFPGVQLEVCRIASYVNDANEVQIVLDRIDGKGQLGKGTLAEIRAQIASTK